MAKRKRQVKNNRSFAIIAIIFVIALSVFLLYKNTSSGTPTGKVIYEDAEGRITKAFDYIDNLPMTDEELASYAKEKSLNYLQRQWVRFATNNKYLFLIINYIDPFSYALFKTQLIPPNWQFWIVLGLFVFFFTYLSRILMMFSTFSNPSAIVLSLGIAILAGVLGMFKIIADKFVSLINFMTNWYMKLFFVILVVVGLLVCSMFQRKILVYLRALRIKQAQRKQTQDVKDLKQKVGFMEKMINIIIKPFQDLGKEE